MRIIKELGIRLVMGMFTWLLIGMVTVTLVAHGVVDNPVQAITVTVGIPMIGIIFGLMILS